MGVFKRLKRKTLLAKKGVRRVAASGIAMGYLSRGRHIVWKKYDEFVKKANALIDGSFKESDWKYWERVVLNKYFDKNVIGGKNALRGEQKTARAWLEEFVPRFKRTGKVTNDDKVFLKEKLIPLMLRQRDKGVDFDVVLEKYGLNPLDFVE